MRLDCKATALAGSALWGLTMLVVGIVNLVQPAYGTAFLQCLSSLYPGYHATQRVGDVLTGTGYALFDGAVTGWLFGWLYNRVAVRQTRNQ
jgi:hypothetical protein